VSGQILNKVTCILDTWPIHLDTIKVKFEGKGHRSKVTVTEWGLSRWHHPSTQCMPHAYTELHQ